ncbi:UNKNOWN [Stylonychia lemnae]|uniref:Proteinase inhibitor I42 chagasin domain-containing protein n=1 Tax=Stylonychia lemnae TaxID=5949 RepID=A0A078B6R9_STYLE|nr:UNKNOWN [Stylonychia lemnae]|eukprot:CDW90240.1 UNKNOWN [Stylonychia lemnae]
MKTQTVAILLVALIGFSVAQKLHHEVDFITYASDNVIEVDGNVGDDIHVRIKENPTTGFNWIIAKESPLFKGLKTEQEKFIRQQSNGVFFPGTGGYKLMKFSIQDGGDKIIDLVQARPWELNTFKDTQGLINWTEVFQSNHAIDRKQIQVKVKA